MMNNIESVMSGLHSQGRKSLSVVLMIADPHPTVTDELIAIAFQNGVDIVELGIPYHDPFLDSISMKDSMNRALGYSKETDFYLEYLKHIRQRYPSAPFEVMVYAQTVKEVGMQGFADKLQQAKMDAVLVADYVHEPAEFLTQWDACLRDLGVIPIRFVPHPFDPQQISDVSANCRGFVISQTVAAEDGSRATVLPENKQKFAFLRENGVDVPIVAAYGIKTPQHVRDVLEMGADGVLIGTSVLDKAYKLPRDQFTDYVSALHNAVVGKGA